MQHSMLQGSARARDKFMSEFVVVGVEHVYGEKVTVQSKIIPVNSILDK